MSMQPTSCNILHKRSIIKKKVERGLTKDIITGEKSQPCLQNERRPGHKENNTFSASKYYEQEKINVVVPSTKDILCGRGKSFINHEGNKRFRDIIGKNRYAYINASRRSKRSEIVRAVVNEMLRTGARFLKKSENKLEWYDGGMKVAREKVGLLILSFLNRSPKGILIIAISPNNRLATP